MDTLERYLESDARQRTGLFKSFLAALKQLRSQDPKAAAAAARRAVSPDLDYTSLLALKRFIHAGKAGPGQEEALRIAVLGGPTTLQLVELIRIFLAGRDLTFELYECEYGLFRQEILTPGSGLDCFRPNIVFLATGARDVGVFPPVAAGREEVERMAEEELSGWAGLWQVVRERWGATVIQNSFDIDPWGVLGHYSLRHPASRENYLALLNRRMAEQAPAHVVLHDLNSLVVAAGARDWFDPRFYLEAKMPCGPECLVAYAHSAAGLVLAIRGKSRKVLVLDLDNTLWGGVVGDDGAEGIQLGQGSGQGEAFLAFQAYCRQLHDRGILLAVCSKNDEEIARRPFRLRDDMILTLDHISCFIANWNNKADNLREIARRLELGVDSLVFVDDNPAERAVVRRFAPEVAVPDMPEDPAGYVAALARHRYFETVSWTREDASRAQYYAQNAERARMASAFADLDSFLGSLEMRARIEPVNPLNIERVTQLVNKSNQFNLTTRRRTRAEIEALSRDPDWHTLTISLADRLGDNGLISVIFLVQSHGSLEIDTWLMSCRVLQRTVEQLALNEIVAAARARGCHTVTGLYIPTERNGMVRDHYGRLGFQASGADDSAARWVLRVDESYQPRHTYIRTEKTHERDSRTIAAGLSAGL
ncbi:MAG: HAD family hydrolase [Bryobacterales bacterium]|nr:HAD family hydrolase [Bryobacterales bacterium]